MTQTMTNLSHLMKGVLMKLLRKLRKVKKRQEREHSESIHSIIHWIVLVSASGQNQLLWLVKVNH